MTLHAKGALPGIVPSKWLSEHSLFVCPSCSQLVSNSRHASHLRQCSQRCIAPVSLQQPVSIPCSDDSQDLPTFDQVCQLNHPTLRYIPAKARPAFARALSSSLRDVLQKNTEDAWLKLFMLPKCVLPSLRHKGNHNPHKSIESLCNMWLNNDLTTLWMMAKSRESNQNVSMETTSCRNYRKVISSAVSLGRSGMTGKACRMLLSGGIVPNNDTTWRLLQAKHPSCPPPVTPDVTSEPITLSPSFNIVPILRSFPKGTSPGPSGLSVQHLLDTISVPLHTPIGTSLKRIVNLLASGKVPVHVSAYLAGGKLIALDKSKEGSPPDVRPIAVGETLRRLTGKCICTILRNKFSSFFEPSQFGVACKAGAEKIVHSLRRCIEDNWLNGDFVVFKVDMLNAFNMVSRQAVLDECATFFPELLPWVSWCYGSHSSLWHPMGQVSSQSGVQQGDPLGPMLFALVLHKLVTSIEVDDDCLHLILEAWYLDDGVLAGEKSAVIRALHLIEELGPYLGLHINFSKCELFSRNGNSHFPPVVESSLLPNMDILGVPIGDFVHCSRFIAEKCATPKTLLKALVDVSAVDLHVAFSILRMCGSYCKLVHLARATPPSHCADYLKLFDEEVRLCFTSCIAVDVPDLSWQQAQLSPSLGGLGFRSLALHSSAAFIASFASSGFCSPDNIHMLQAVTRFNAQVHPLESTTAEAVLACPPLQRALSKKLDNHAFQSLLSSSSQVNKARILSVSAPHAGSWISATPSTGLDLHLDSAECQVALRWWLGLDTSGGSPCPLCPDTALDPLGHHAATCRHGGDVVARHNRLRDIVTNFCRRAHLSVQVEVGYGLARDHINSRPADILVQGWDRGKPAAFDVTVTSPLTPVSLNNASASVGAAAYAAECRKHAANDTRCQELGWLCIPLAVETYGNWGKEAQSVFSRLASLLSISQAIPKPKMLSEIYSRLNMSLVRSVARAIMGREAVQG